MSNIAHRIRMETLAFGVPAMLYLAIATPVAIRHRAAINPDGIIYIRKAQFLLAGQYWESVSGYWSPAMSWCVALVIRLFRGGDPLHAIHGVLAFWGLTWVFASCAVLRSLLPGRSAWRVVAGVAIAFSGVRQAVSLITPDLLLGTMLMAYLAAVSSPRLLKRPRTALTAGICAGIGYLCKSYALPFFCLHFPLTIIYRYWSARRGAGWNPLQIGEAVGRRRALVTLLLGGVGFAVLALPWVGLLSYKYGHFTISMVYHHNHMNVAEESVQENLPDFCVVPPDPYLSIWEGLDPGPRKDWSPFSSWQNFRHQIWIAGNHAWLIVSNVAGFDYLGLTLLAAVAALIPFQHLTARPLFSAVPGWIVMTCGVYCLGFLVVAFEVRYIVPILLPLGIALCLREWDDLSIRSQSPSFAAVPFAVAALFSLSAFIGMASFAFDSPTRPMFAQVATLLRRKHLDGLFTSSDNNRGVNVSYFLNRKIVLMPFRPDAESVQKELSAAGVTEALIWSDSRTDTPDSYPRHLTSILLQTGHWRHALGQKLDSVRRVDVYRFNASVKASSRPTTQEPDQNENQTEPEPAHPPRGVTNVD